MPEQDDYVRRGELAAMLKELANEIRWVRWVAFASLAVAASPKFGGPTVPQVGSTIVSLVGRAFG